MQPYNILIVDDDEDIRFVILMNLQQKNYNFIESSSGNDAYKKLKELHVDLVITDMMMPDGTGLELLQKIRQEDKQLPVIVLTAYSKLSNENLFGYGATAFFDKPIDYSKLEQEISKQRFGTRPTN